MPRDVESALDKMKGVRATTVRAGIDWMTSSHSAGGKTVDSPQPGYAIPIEMLVVDPREYSHFVAPADRQVIQRLSGHQVVLARTEAALRGGGKGLRLDVGRTLRATGVVSNHSTQGYEGLLPKPLPSSWTNAARFVLIRAKRSVSKTHLRRVIASRLAPGQLLRIHSQYQARYLRYADAVEPPLILKKNFGEFSARRVVGGGFQLDSTWLAHYLRTESVPILGSFPCNRKLFPQVRGAMAEIRAKGLSHLVDPSQFAGCFNPRLIPSAHSTQLSHHAWGVAVDINSRDNPFGARPHQDPRLVAIMRKWGLTWGGAWLVPDGMHFEWKRFP
ncbi:MAG: M15 family metallopeptidase [Actinomycetota bacterium]|nr:M15 family metallopeptidase [Actinomycetota bacterium]